MRDLVTTLVELAGAVLVSVGVGLIHVPSGLVVAGAWCVLIGILNGER